MTAQPGCYIFCNYKITYSPISRCPIKGRIGKPVKFRRGPAAVTEDETCKISTIQEKLAGWEGAGARMIPKPEDLPRYADKSFVRQRYGNWGLIWSITSSQKGLRFFVFFSVMFFGAMHTREYGGKYENAT